MNNLEQKRVAEKELIKKMILIYCKHHHKSKELCKECEELYQYASKRIDKCPFMETKSFCSQCKVHCYQADHRTKIKQVMRYSGKHLLYRNPILAIRHLISTIKQKYQEE